jgi:hypothetical protein
MGAIAEEERPRAHGDGVPARRRNHPSQRRLYSDHITYLFWERTIRALYLERRRYHQVTLPMEEAAPPRSAIVEAARAVVGGADFACTAWECEV